MVKRVTLADVAQRASVSTMTVSRVLNNKGEISDDTRRRVLAVVDELGYRPNRIARSLATSKTLKIGIVIPGISSYYFGAIFEGTERVLWDNDYHILLCNTGNDAKRERSIMNLFEEDRVDGVIVFSSHLPPDTLSDYLKRQHAAVVLNSEVDRDVAGRILVDEHSAMRMAVNHLLDSGRTRLGFIGSNSPTLASKRRWEGFISAMHEAGHTPNPEWMITCKGRNNWAKACSATHELLAANPQINGIVCFNDDIAAGAVRTCVNLGRRVPEDVAIVGYDDILLAEVLSIPLTTLRLNLDKSEVGEITARMLLERIDGQCEQSDIILHHELVIRDSAP